MSDTYWGFEFDFAHKAVVPAPWQRESNLHYKTPDGKLSEKKHFFAADTHNTFGHGVQPLGGPACAHMRALDDPAFERSLTTKNPMPAYGLRQQKDFTAQLRNPRANACPGYGGDWFKKMDCDEQGRLILENGRVGCRKDANALGMLGIPTTKSNSRTRSSSTGSSVMRDLQLAHGTALRGPTVTMGSAGKHYLRGEKNSCQKRRHSMIEISELNQGKVLGKAGRKQLSAVTRAALMSVGFREDECYLQAFGEPQQGPPKRATTAGHGARRH